jgi:hypothetical protein
MAEAQRKSFPWRNLARVKAQILQTPFSELDEIVNELSESIISIEKVESADTGYGKSIEDFEDENRDDWDPETEYGEEESGNDETGSGEETSEELEIEKNYESWGQKSLPNPELEIIKTGNSFFPKVNTYDVSSRWLYKGIGDKSIDNAGNAIITSMEFRSDVLRKIGKYFIEKQLEYLKNINNKERHWYRKPLNMSKILGEQKKSNVSRVINGTSVLLPNGEIENLKDFFEKTRMPVSSICIATEIAKLLAINRNLTNKAISTEIKNKAEKYHYNLELSERMVSNWRKKYSIK